MENKKGPKPKKGAQTLTVSPLRTQTQHPEGHVDTSIPAGEQIGSYKIIQLLGRGGMGAVYLAEQEKPIRRQVAIKIIKPGMDSREIIARFESEQQALALMNHPHIAQVYDAGETDKGYPYFVMEHVPGDSITDYCDKHKMTTRERLKLFEKVCDAVQHAHFKGIVHRDLKPSNVLVTFQDDNHVPKVIDFGIAKALADQKLTEKTLETMPGLGVGTPTYMSPEQAELSGKKIDTRTDVYSLGLILYEMLVGVSPFDKKILEKAGLMEMLRVIREDEPPKPSARFNTLGDTSTEIAKMRKTSPVTITRQLHGDLDWIVLKAIEKDQDRRYNSPTDLVADINRYLNRDPIQARPPSVIYKAKKYIRKHKAASIAAMSIFLIIVLFSVWNVAERRKAEKSLYFNDIDLADREWIASNIGQANRLLAEAPIRLRNWEWHYLWRMTHPEEVSTSFEINSIPGALAFSADGQRIYSSNADKTLTTWEGKTSAEISTVKLDFDGRFVEARFSSDGKLLAERYILNPSEQIGTLVVWDTGTGRQCCVLPQFESITAFTFSPDGTRLVTARSVGPKYRGLLEVWSTETGNKISDLSQASSVVTELSFCSDGKRLATVGRAFLDVIDATSGEKIIGVTPNDPLTTISRSVKFSPDGTLLAEINKRYGLRAWSAADGSALWTFNPGPEIGLVEFGRNGALVAILSDRTLRVLDPATGEQTAQLTGHAAPVFSVTFSPDETRLVSASVDKTLRIWKLGEPLVKVDLNQGQSELAQAAAISPDGGQIAILTNTAVKLWDLRTRGEIFVVPHPNSFEFPFSSKLFFNRDGTSLVYPLTRRFNSDDGQRMSDNVLVVVDTQTGRKVTTLLPQGSKRHSPVDRFVGISQQGNRVALISNLQLKPRWVDEFEMWQLPDGKSLFRIPLSQVLGGPWFAPDGRAVVVATLSPDNEQIFTVYDATSGRVVHSFDRGLPPAAFNKNGTILATTTENNRITLWNTRTWKKRVVLPEHSSSIDALSFSLGGTRLVSVSKDETVRVFDVLTGRQTLILRESGGALNVQQWLFVGSHSGFGSSSVGFSEDDTNIVLTNYLFEGKGFGIQIKTWDGSPLGTR